MKRTIKLLFAIMTAVLCISIVFSSCGFDDVQNDKTSDKKIITVSVFPIWDWTYQIARGSDGVDVRLLLSSGTDMHSYQPSAADILKITSSDMFVFVGGESDEWASKALENDATKKTLPVVVTDELRNRLLKEESLPGIEDKHSHSHEEEEIEENDEHVWLSLENALIYSDIIAKKLSEADPDNSDLYYKNAAEYKSKITTLENEYDSVISNAKNDVLIVCDRFPFRYLADEFSLRYYAAFSGCTSETDASFKTVSFLAKKADEEKVGALIVADGSDKKLARTVASCLDEPDNIKILTLDSMQTVTKNDIDSGMTYLSVMENNLKVLNEALNGEK